jgi:hypothetical protein
MHSILPSLNNAFHASRSRFPSLTAITAALVLVSACSKPAPPPIVQAGGTITLNGNPLPNASIRFVPLFKGFGGDVIAEAVSDPAGKFSLVCMGTNGACVGEHRVIVEEGPLPKEAQGESGRAQMAMTRFLQSLPNRPIPAAYGNAAQSPLTVEITADQATYDLKLAR